MLGNNLMNWRFFLQFCLGFVLFSQMTYSQAKNCDQYYFTEHVIGVPYGNMQIPFENNFHVELELTGKEKFAAQLVLITGENCTRHNEHLKYYVDFENAFLMFPEMLPEASRIAVNGKVICESEEDPEHRYKLKLWNSGSYSIKWSPKNFVNFQAAFRTAGLTNASTEQSEPESGLIIKILDSNDPFSRKNSLNLTTASTEQSVIPSCGRRTTSIAPFIHHGKDLSPGEMPWLTAIYQKTRNAGTEFLCGGTLVSARTAITAAHCFRIPHLTKDDVVVHMGRHNLRDFRSPFTVRELENLIIHPDYNASRMADADIAIMHFTEPVVFNELISPICLWSGPNDVAQIVGQKGYIAGWGAAENGISVTNIPKKVDADIVDDMTCVRHNEGYIRLVSGRTLCAGNLDGSGPCSGDSGGGLMIQRDGRWLLRGIVSAGKTDNGMCALNTYVLYCDLAKHMTWVHQNVID